MDRFEGIRLLQQQLAELVTLPYTKLQDWQQRKHVEVFDVESETGKFYRIEVQVSLEDRYRANGIIRVTAMIDDSHMFSTNTRVPLTQSFLIGPDNRLILE